MGDGVPDNPGSQLWQKPVRTGMTRNYSTSIGLSATLSLPLDGGLQERCKQAADTQIALQQQLLANKRLDFELARLKNCGELLQKGIRFHPRSPYAKVCADVVVQNVNTSQTTRTYNSTYFFSGRTDLSAFTAWFLWRCCAAILSFALCTGIFLPRKAATFFITFFTVRFHHF